MCDMNTLSEKRFHSERPGYWAIQVRLAPSSDPAQRYLCHAPNERAASETARRFMGVAANVRGYDISWIDEALLQKTSSSLPPIGASRTVRDPDEWAELMAASARSEAAQQRAAL